MTSVVCRLPRQVAWGDCDPAGIIYYPTYYRWMDAATWALLEQVGYPASRIRAEGWTIPSADTQCAFKSSPTYGDGCEVRASVTRWGRSSFVVGHAFVHADGRLLAQGSETRVWCQYEAGPGTRLRSGPVPPALRQALGEPA